MFGAVKVCRGKRASSSETTGPLSAAVVSCVHSTYTALSSSLNVLVMVMESSSAAEAGFAEALTVGMAFSPFT